MAALHRLIAVYLFLAGVAVGAYFIISPIYAGQGNPGHAGDVWNVLNWFMAAAALLLMLVTFAHVRALAAGASTWDKFVANGRFHLAAALLIAFFSNWFADLWGGDGSSPSSIIWIFANVAMPILAVEMALQLWRDPEIGGASS